MGRYHTVEVEVDLGDFDDDEIRAEAESRGFRVAKGGEISGGDAIDEAIWRLNRGELADALYAIERTFPDLIGLVDAVFGTRRRAA